ncbi:THO complex subunit 2-like [Chenopodium quinoa]|uniref:THO complex subunit 2-like n=1 Tax=Chenopodium quinoa TaxID=63459 RepID=UPI000B77130E|nr:THO complex subunit 2-like [Chenopodium quinoa]
MSLPSIEFAYLTGDFLRQLKDGDPNLKLPNPVPVLRFLFELVSSMVYGTLPFQKCNAALDAVEFSDVISEEELGSYFADIVTQMALDLTMSGEIRARLIKLARWLVECSLVPVRFFQERCEEEFLWECEMVKIKAQELKSKEVRVNTRLLYQQTKFNLLREESEGYAKLVTLLCEGSGDPNSSSSKIGTIKSLIGHFDLDPNRVFDIVMECFEMQPDNKLFLDLIPIFPKSHASQILGFKFQYYQRMEVQNPVPFGLYRLAALLVKEDLVDLDSIYAHLIPKDEEAFETFNAITTKRLHEANKIGKINLAATGKDLMDDEKQGDVTVDLYVALEMENQAVNESVSELEDCQTLGLLTGFLLVDDWYHANILFERLSPLNPVAYAQICDELFRLIGKSISSAYDIVRKMHLESFMNGPRLLEDADSSKSSLILLPKELFEMLTCAGPYLYRDTLLLQKICRILKSYYLSALELISKGDGAPGSVIDVNINPRLHLREARSRIEEALGSCLLPSLQLVPANPAIGHAIWEVMSLLPYEARYRLYGEWEKDDERIPMILAARQTAKLDTRRILKRLAKENLKQLGRMVAKLAHANPMTVLRTIVQQIEAYRDMIMPVVDAFKYLTQLEYDVLEYVVIERLAQSGREKLKDDGLNLSDWLQSLASFWGHLCKKYPSMELRGLFQYLVNQLKRGKGIELLLLQELIQQMANVQYTENMTEEQLDSMAGGETLRYLATSYGISRNNKALAKSTNRLRDSLVPKEEPKLAIPLLVLIAQHRSLVVTNADAPYIKMLSEQFDRCHGVLLQYVDFLCNAVSPVTAYAQLVPTLDDLVHLYHLDPEVIFLIYRPVMRLFKCKISSVSWPLCDRDEPSDAGELVLDLGPPCNPVRWSFLLDTVRTMLPAKAWNSLSPDLYATFWGLTLYDLYVPRSRYESEIAKQHASLKALEELSDNSGSAIAKRKKDKERIQESLDRLTSELQKHEENVASVQRRLANEKDNWLSSCPDTLKINMEFLQRCIFPRCIFSMPDAVYCAKFVHTLHSLGTPFFNTVNHLDVLICKTLHPMICCCTDYEAGRLGRFLFETLKIAYHWKSDESVYERECGNMPGFAVYYRYPNSQRVTYGQFIKVHWKWSQRITRLLIQCLESAEYMEIRNALIVLTKITSVFPVTRKSGINIEKRVAKIKGEEREDLKVLATGVAAALAARKPSWVTEDEFGMGYLELKPAPSVAPKSSTGNSLKDQAFRVKIADGKSERSENVSGNAKKGGSIANGSDVQPTGAQVGVSRSLDSQKQVDEPSNKTVDENNAKGVLKLSTDSEKKNAAKRTSAGAGSKQLKQELKDEAKSAKIASRTGGASASERDHGSHLIEGRQTGQAAVLSASVTNGNSAPSSKGLASSTRVDLEASELRGEVGSTKSSNLRGSLRDDGTDQSDFPRPSHARSAHSPKHDTGGRAVERQQKRTSPAEEPDRLHKRRKGDSDVRDTDVDVRLTDREKTVEQKVMDKSYSSELDNSGTEESALGWVADKHVDRTKEKNSEKYERDYRDRSERSDKLRGDDISEKARDRSMERYGRERSVDKVPDRRIERGFDGLNDKARDERSKDDRVKLRYNEVSGDKSHNDDRFHCQNLPPPPPLPPHVVPQSVNRRDDDAERRLATTRHAQRLSPKHDEKERRRSEESLLTVQDDSRRRREDEFRDRKREEREISSMKVEEREREKEKERERDRERANLLKEEIDSTAASKRRKLKREHIPGGEPGEYSPVAPPPPISIGIPQAYDARERGDRKGTMVQRPAYFEEPGMRLLVKEPPSKMVRRDVDPTYERDWDDEKRLRAEAKRRHRK